MAEARLSKFKNEQRARVDVEVATADAKITFGEAAVISSTWFPAEESSRKGSCFRVFSDHRDGPSFLTMRQNLVPPETLQLSWRTPGV
ncbi:hypothetical protein DB345_05255 [Spartobacteria bacterium LR76]|nr:hypothetical protein DB345_05255 [Spartobacteria bacterium LR76]